MKKLIIKKSIRVSFLILGLTIVSCNSTSDENANKAILAQLEQSNQTTEVEINNVIGDWNESYQYDKIACAPLYYRILKANQLSKQLFNYLETVKNEKINFNIDSILNKVYQYNSDLKHLSSPHNRKLVDSILIKKSAYQLDFSSYKTKYQRNIFLTIIQNDIRKSEFYYINNLLLTFNHFFPYDFDTLGVRVIPQSNIVKLGEKYKAEIVIAAARTTMNPKIYIAQYDSINNKMIGKIDSTSIKVMHGVGYYETQANSLGSVTKNIVLYWKIPDDNNWLALPAKIDYKVIK